MNVRAMTRVVRVMTLLAPLVPMVAPLMRPKRQALDEGRDGLVVPAWELLRDVDAVFGDGRRMLDRASD
jgi:hypothetical protein